MKGPFLGGDESDSLDLLRFSIVCAVAVFQLPILALQSDPRLTPTRHWISEMQKYFEDYPSLYSGVYFEPHSSHLTVRRHVINCRSG